ncbi:hypothetical protein H1S01_03090 [Heliobacterium chlorum]|uniref:Uncharacterized protein n=1 Tax=Heliobacterium chlorum TaxID=2698 RepID=A0ABR7SYJ5_HELCL|nr:hypothetical protein [Heliobacterium chlorum]MBC9783496.1 hypothetical protein [Heliobacterium chlorum]
MCMGSVSATVMAEAMKEDAVKQLDMIRNYFGNMKLPWDDSLSVVDNVRTFIASKLPQVDENGYEYIIVHGDSCGGCEYEKLDHDEQPCKYCCEHEDRFYFKPKKEK